MGCPICTSEKTTLLHEFSADEAANHFILREENRERHADLENKIASLWRKNQGTVKICKDCGFGFSDPFVAGDAEFYNIAYDRVGYPSEKWDYSRTVAHLRKTAFAGKRVLELGSGFGYFLDQIADRFVPRNGIVALEYGEAQLLELRRKGYSAIAGDVREPNHISGPFDAIFLFQVLEHMDSLEVLFERLKSLLAPGGVIFITVPNERRTNFNEMNGSLLDMPPNHIGRWSPKAFQYVCARTGLQIDALEYEPFNPVKFIVTDIIYSQKRDAQLGRRLATWARGQRRSSMRRWMGHGLALATSPRRIVVWIKGFLSLNMGASVWVRLSAPSRNSVSDDSETNIYMGKE